MRDSQLTLVALFSPQSPACTALFGTQGPKVYTFTATHEPSWAEVCQWRVPLAGSFDPATEDFLGQPLGTGEGDDEPLVELSCSIPPNRCIFRKSVIRRCLMSSPRCPSCGYFFLVPGPQPSGTLSVKLESFSCEGFPRKGTLVLHYSFPSGTQGARMKRPGQSYCGTSRTVYLPNTDKGREGCHLLVKAFERGHLFVVGDSVTTGAQNCVVWGGIHQKTSTSGGTECHGWPDSTYFERLQHECAGAGVFTDTQERYMQRTQERDHRRLTEALVNNISTPDVAVAGGAIDKTNASRQEEITRLNAAILQAMKARNVRLIQQLMKERQVVQTR